MSLFLAIDGNSLMHRAFHALPLLDDGKGQYTNAVFGFTGMLLRLLSERKPDYVAVAFDLHGPTFRHDQFEAYKAGRKPMAEELRPQFPLIHQVLEYMGIRILEVERFEADDLLGAVAAACEAQGVPALLVTGDRDALQLVTDQTHVLYTKRGISDTVEFDPQTVLEQYGISPGQVPDLKGFDGRCLGQHPRHSRDRRKDSREAPFRIRKPGRGTGCRGATKRQAPGAPAGTPGTWRC